MSEIIGVDSTFVGLHTDLVTKLNSAFRDRDELSILNFKSVLNASTEQKKQNVKNVLGIDYTQDEELFSVSELEYVFTVPSNYNTHEDFNSFCSRHRNEFTYIDPRVGLRGFVVDILERGATYVWEYYRLRHVVSLKNCIAFLKRKGSLLVGVPGLTFIYDNFQHRLPRESMLLSFYKYQKGDRNFISAGIEYTKNCECNFKFGPFNFKKVPKPQYYCLLCVRKK